MITVKQALAKIYSDASPSERRHAIEVLETMEKCGGPGGTMGPCPAGGTGGGGSSGGPEVPKALKKFVPKDLDTSEAGKVVNVKKGAIGFDIGNTRSNKPRYQFNTATPLPILGTIKRGVGEYEHTRYIAIVPAKIGGGKDTLLEIHSQHVE